MFWKRTQSDLGISAFRRQRSLAGVPVNTVRGAGGSPVSQEGAAGIGSDSLVQIPDECAKAPLGVTILCKGTFPADTVKP